MKSIVHLRHCKDKRVAKMTWFENVKNDTGAYDLVEDMTKIKWNVTGFR